MRPITARPPAAKEANVNTISYYNRSGRTGVGMILIGLVLGLAGMVSGPAAAQEESEPVKAVRAFYQAVADQNCDLALTYRPGYKKSRCQTITKPNVKRVEELYNEAGVAVCSLDLTFREAGMPSVWTGFVKVVNQGESWIITEDYRSDIRFEQYMAEVIKTAPTPADGSTAGASQPATGNTAPVTPDPEAGNTAPDPPDPEAGNTTQDPPDPEAGNTTQDPPDPEAVVDPEIPAVTAAPEVPNQDLYYDYRSVEQTPTQAVRRYFSAVAANDVAAACALRTDCSDQIKDEVKANRGGKLEVVEEKSNDGSEAKIYVEVVQLSLDGGSVRWKQDLTLKKTDDGWKIQYHSPAAFEAQKPETTPAPSGDAASPEQVIKDYYQALDAHDVETACGLRQVCDDPVKKKIRGHSKIEIQKTILKKSDDRSALVYTESVETDETGAKVLWKQDWVLKKSGREWKIIKTENYSSENLP